MLATNEARPADAEDATNEEGEVLDKLTKRFKGSIVSVQDVSGQLPRFYVLCFQLTVGVAGGCGSFYAISIVHPDFKVRPPQLLHSIMLNVPHEQGLTQIKSHRLVNEALQEEVARWHGIQVRSLLEELYLSAKTLLQLKTMAP